MERPEPVNPEPANTPPGAPPRAFAQGTGLVLQTVGAILFLSSCCVCTMTGLWDPVASRGETIESIRSGAPIGQTLRTMFDSPAETGYMLTAMFTTLGGLALAVCGLGLQSERRRAAWGAMVTVVIMLLTLVVAAAALWAGGGAVVAKLWNAILLLVTLVISGFVYVSLRQVLANPPPADVDIVKPGTKIPYSFYHDDPPSVRLAKELEARRKRLEEERKEIERMERELREGEEKN